MAPLPAGTQLGPYEIVALLGAGGMGEVYRARDTRLKREVAIKVLPEAFAQDAERLARIRREAQVLASLNHSNIATIYGLEESSGAHALVLELVDGPTLADRIAAGPIPIDESLPIARQIAEALEAAHELGIIHRDLKPANIKVRDDGAVKVLDFGLAKPLEPTDVGRSFGSGDPDAATSPTRTSPAMTMQGVVLGTAAYMSPEQARGRAIDKRADIWAFGAVLYEMLTGRQAFAGESITDVLAAVMKDTPHWRALPVSTPPAIRRLLTRCLEKAPKRRLRDIGDARLEIESAVEEPMWTASAPPRPSRMVLLAWGLVAIVMAAAVGTAAWLLKPSTAQPVRRFDLGPALARVPAGSGALKISPDGSRLTYLERGHLWVRKLEELDARDLGEVPSDSYGLLWSPVGESIAFVSPDRKLRRIPASGGSALVICTLPEPGRLLGAAWRTDGTIVLALWRGGLYRVNASGGSPEPLLAIDPAKEVDFHSLGALPDGRVIYSVHAQPNAAGGGAEMFDGRRRSALGLEGSTGPIGYAPTGHLLFERENDLWAVPFGRLPLDMAKAFLVDARVREWSVGGDGALVVVHEAAGGVSELVLTNLTGQVLRVIGPKQASISNPALSPDGHRVAVASA